MPLNASVYFMESSNLDFVVVVGVVVAVTANAAAVLRDLYIEFCYATKYFI